MIGSSITAKGTKSSAKFAKDLTDAKISLWTLRWIYFTYREAY